MEQHPDESRPGGAPAAEAGDAFDSAAPSAPAPGADDEQDDAGEDGSPLDFAPVSLRFRHDGWTPDRQQSFIYALAESGCVVEAARCVGKSAASAYALRVRPEAQSFRLAWDAALDMAMARMSDAAIGRAIHGVPVPHFYKGEKIGEHRRYDERLTMWMLRYRDPVRYGKWLDRVTFKRHPEGPAITLMHRLLELWDDAFGMLKSRLRIEPIDVERDSGP